MALFGLVNHGLRRLCAVARAGSVGPVERLRGVQDVRELALWMNAAIVFVNPHLPGLSRIVGVATDHACDGAQQISNRVEDFFRGGLHAFSLSHFTLNEVHP